MVRAMTGLLRHGLVMATAACTAFGVGCAGSAEMDTRRTDESSGESAVNDDREAAMRIEYGDHADAFGELWLPRRDGEPSAVPVPVPVPVVVLLHGGFWRDGFFLDLMNPLVPSLLDDGYAVWNVEYRRVGAGGGYPATFIDVAGAIDRLADLSATTGMALDLDLDRVAVVGHSAGGHLAAWATGRGSLPPDAVGADPAVLPVVAVAQAGVLDLVGCAREGVGGTACIDLIGAAPADDPGRYAVTSPQEMVPFDAVVVAVHGELDRIVPTSQSIGFVERATDAGMDATHVAVADADHFSNLDPRHPAWRTVLDSLERHL